MLFTILEFLLIICSDMVGQAKKIIDLIKKNSQIDFEKDWKLVTILVGTYDLCNSCANPVSLFYFNLLL